MFSFLKISKSQKVILLSLGSLLVFSLGIAIGIFIGSPDHADKISYSSEESDHRIVNKELKEVIIAETQKPVDLHKSLPNLDQFKSEKVFAGDFFFPGQMLQRLAAGRCFVLLATGRWFLYFSSRGDASYLSLRGDASTILA